jgi:aryl-alcohol dehydrogenase-like predicted oxidoreductase
VRKGTSAAVLALSWVLARGEDVVALFGTKRRTYLEENVKAIDLPLSAAELAELDRIAPRGVAAGDRYPDMSLVNR